MEFMEVRLLDLRRNNFFQSYLVDILSFWFVKWFDDESYLRELGLRTPIPTPRLENIPDWKFNEIFCHQPLLQRYRWLELAL